MVKSKFSNFHLYEKGKDPNGFRSMKLSVIIPVYNEVKTITKTIERVMNAPVDIDREIILVDDCSSDGSGDVIKGLSSNYPNVMYRINETNLGKGASLVKGFAV
mgnify:CR=1 FL=1